MLIAARNAIAGGALPYDKRVEYVESVDGAAYFHLLDALPNISETPEQYDPTWVDLWEVVLGIPDVPLYHRDLKYFGMTYMFGLSEYNRRWRPSLRDYWPTNEGASISECNPVMFRCETGKLQMLTADGMTQKWVKTGNYFVRFPNKTWTLGRIAVGTMFDTYPPGIIAQTPGTNRVYSFRRVLKGVPEFTLVPCEKNGVAGMYDEVSGTFCASTSGTPFVSGPDK